MTCPECRGSGTIVLFTSSVPCTCATESGPIPIGARVRLVDGPPQFRGVRGRIVEDRRNDQLNRLKIVFDQPHGHFIGMWSDAAWIEVLG